MSWTVSNHAAKRVTERFGVKSDDVPAWISEKMDASRFVCITSADDGNEARMFCAGKIMLYADLIEDHVMSVRYASMTRSAAERIALLAEKEMRRNQLRLLESERELAQLKAQLEAEKIELRIALVRTKSASKSESISARLNAVETRLREVAADIKRERRELTYLAEGIVALSV